MKKVLIVYPLDLIQMCQTKFNKTFYKSKHRKNILLRLNYLFDFFDLYIQNFGQNFHTMNIFFDLKIYIYF